MTSRERPKVSGTVFKTPGPWEAAPLIRLVSIIMASLHPNLINRNKLETDLLDLNVEVIPSQKYRSDNTLYILRKVIQIVFPIRPLNSHL